jgi:hypothetical protein
MVGELAEAFPVRKKLLDFSRIPGVGGAGMTVGFGPQKPCGADKPPARNTHAARRKGLRMATL